MKTRTLERDASLAAAYLGVAVSGALLLVASGIWFGARVTAQVALGVVVALSNLWILEQLVRAYLEARRGRWAVVALAKGAALLAVVGILLKTGVVALLPLITGFGALPLGVVVGGAWPTRGET